MDDSAELALLALDVGKAFDERVAALSSLAAVDPGLAKEVGLQLAERSIEQVDFLRSVGTMLAQVSHHGNTVSEFDVRDMTEAAFDAFCEWMP